MGTIVNQVIDALTGAGIRADEAYPGGRIPALTGAVAAVRLGKVDRTVRTTAVQVTVMSPADLGGGLCDGTALRAVQALEQQGAACQKELCRFDDMADLFFTEITAEFFGVALENGWLPGPGFAVSIGLQEMEWATGFSISRKPGTDSQWEFTLEELLGAGSVDPPDPGEPFTMTVLRQNGDEVFTGCTWTSIQRKDTLRGISQVRTGTAKTRNVTGVM